MANYRQGRINDEMKKAIAEIIRTVKDPRVCEAFISITGAEVTKDLKFAKIYYSALSAKDNESKTNISKGLKSSLGYIRREVSKRLNLRITPELTFIEDTSIQYGAHISKLLNEIDKTSNNNIENDVDIEDIEK